MVGKGRCLPMNCPSTVHRALQNADDIFFPGIENAGSSVTFLLCRNDLLNDFH